MADERGEATATTAELPVIAEMADLLAKQKLVPFFGAGISRQHLGLAAAELAYEMAMKVGLPPTTWLSEVSDRFMDQWGEEELSGQDR